MGFHGECGRGWSTRCAASRGRKCRCKCGGANHGKLAQPLDPVAQDVIAFGKRHAHFRIEQTRFDERIVIRDLGPWDQHPTVTNDAEWVVEQIAGLVGHGRLFYYDSDNHLDELLVRDGRFVGFAPGPDTLQEATL